MKIAHWISQRKNQFIMAVIGIKVLVMVMVVWTLVHFWKTIFTSG